MRLRYAALARNVVALSVLAALAGCSSLNPFNWFGDSDGPKPAPLVEIAKPLSVRTVWQARLGSANGHALVPAVVGGSVYAAAFDGAVARFDEASGKELWRVDVGNAVSGGVGSDGERVVVGTMEGEVITLDNAGRVMWRARVSSEVLASPVVAGDIIVVRSADSRMFGLDARDGKRLWVYQRAAPALSVRSSAGMVVRGGYVFAGFAGGKLVAVALNNGGLRWEGTVALPKGTTELERVADVIGDPWVSEREACAVAFQGRAACFNLGSGSQIWAREMSSSVGLDVDSSRLYVSESVGAVSALDRENGASVWRQDRLANRHPSAPLAVGPEVIVGDVEGFVHWLARDSGEFVARQATDGSPIRATPVLSAQGVLVQTTNGGLYVLSLE